MEKEVQYLNKRMKKVICFFIAIFIIVLIVAIVFLLMLKYEVEGENNMPFELSQVVVISTAKGIELNGENTWNFNLMQNNDVYIHIAKNKSYKGTEIIKGVTLNNFNINQKPIKGEAVIYRPSKKQEETYEYIDEYLIGDSLIYNGSEKTDIKNLTIANQGGIIAFRSTNKDLRNIFITKCNT